jgi:hypothetical protein
VHASLEELQFANTNADQGMFVYRKGDNLCVVILYIDDAIFLGNNPDIVMELKGKFMVHWECRDLDLVEEFLGLRITHLALGLVLDQQNYTKKIIARFHLENAKGMATPLLPNVKLPLTLSAEEVNPDVHKLYQEMVSSALYLVHQGPVLRTGKGLKTELNRNRSYRTVSHGPAGPATGPVYGPLSSNKSKKSPKTGHNWSWTNIYIQINIQYSTTKVRESSKGQSNFARVFIPCGHARAIWLYLQPNT